MKANITVLPSTKDSSIFVRGLLQHSLVSDPSNIGYGDLKYVQNMDKRGSYFELNSDLPQTLGRFNLNTQHQVSVLILKTFYILIESLYILNYCF